MGRAVGQSASDFFEALPRRYPGFRVEASMLPAREETCPSSSGFLLAVVRGSAPTFIRRRATPGVPQFIRLTKVCSEKRLRGVLRPADQVYR